jgi:hypothetical protein
LLQRKIRKVIPSREEWLMPIISATSEAKMGRICGSRPVQVKT